MSTISEDLRDEAKGIRRELIFMDIAIMAMGVLMTIFPDQSRDVICRAVGIVLCVWGVIRVIEYFIAKGTEAFGSFALVQGAAMIGFGVYFLIKPEFLAAFLTVALAIILLIGGVMKFQFGIDLVRLKVKSWWVELIGALLMIALGVIAFVNPFDAASGLMMFIGISFIVDGIWDMVSILWLSNAAKKVKKAVEAETVTEEQQPPVIVVDAEDVRDDVKNDE